MLKSCVGYINLKDVVHQIEENKKNEMIKNFYCCNEDYVFYKEKSDNYSPILLLKFDLYLINYLLNYLIFLIRLLLY